MKKVSAYIILLAVTFTVSCASHPSAQNDDFETIPFRIQEQSSETVPSDTSFVLCIGDTEYLPQFLENTAQTFLRKITYRLLDSYILRNFTIHGRLLYEEYSEDIYIHGFELKRFGSVRLIVSVCGDMHMIQCDELEKPFLFESIITGRKYYYDSTVHLGKRNCIVDEEDNLLAFMDKKKLKLSNKLSLQERTDVIQCIGLLKLYQYFFW